MAKIQIYGFLQTSDDGRCFKKAYKQANFEFWR